MGLVAETSDLMQRLDCRRFKPLRLLCQRKPDEILVTRLDVRTHPQVSAHGKMLRRRFQIVPLVIYFSQKIIRPDEGQIRTVTSKFQHPRGSLEKGMIIQLVHVDPSQPHHQPESELDRVTRIVAKSVHKQLGPVACSSQHLKTIGVVDNHTPARICAFLRQVLERVGRHFYHAFGLTLKKRYRHPSFGDFAEIVFATNRVQRLCLLEQSVRQREQFKPYRDAKLEMRHPNLRHDQPKMIVPFLRRKETEPCFEQGARGLLIQRLAHRFARQLCPARIIAGSDSMVYRCGVHTLRRIPLMVGILGSSQPLTCASVTSCKSFRLLITV